MKWKQAGRELVKGNLGNAIKALSFDLDPTTYSSTGKFLFDSAGNTITHFDFSGHNSSLIAYSRCAPVNAIINRKAQAYINGKTLITNTQGKAKGKEATGGMASQIRSLMQRPNFLQSWKQFEAQNYIYQQLCGYCVVLPIKPVGFSNRDAVRLWNIPPFMLQVIEKPYVNLFTATSAKDFVDSVQLVWGGESTTLNLDEIFICRDISVSPVSFVFPGSRIQALQQPVNNIIGAYDSRNVLINRRGAQGILSNAGKDTVGLIPLDPKDKEDLQTDFRSYGLRSSQYQVIITNAALQWQQMGFPTKDLMLFEEIEDDVERICDAYNYPYRLLSSNKINSLGGSDLKEFKKLLYQDAIIPEAESMYEQWNQFFGLEEFGIEITKDYKHIAALQEDQVNEATARFQRNRGAVLEFQNNVLTLNEWRAMNGDEPLTNGLGDLYYYELLEKGIKFAQGTSGASNPDQVNQANPNADANQNTNQ